MASNNQEEEEDTLPSFRIGLEDSPEMNREIRFTMSHHRQYDDDYLYEEDYDENVFQIHRFDSAEILFEPKKKKVKFLGKYMMGDLLGEGSYAKVKEVIDTETLVRRAVKIMKRKKLRKIPNGESNVEREIRLLRDLKHKNIMKLVDVFYNEEKGKIYMILEYCCAVLKDMLEAAPRKKFPISQAHDYFKQLMEGLEFLHSQRVVHKDIKPGNLLLDRSEVLKIADFGVAEKLNLYEDPEKAMLKPVQSTPAFVPPEIANGLDPSPAYKIDVWSSGVTLFNFVTGEYPFEEDNIYRLLELIAKAEFSFPQGSGLDPVLKDLIKGMLRKDPVLRLSVQDVLGHDWFRKRHPIHSTHVPVNINASSSNSDLVTSLIPYLNDLHIEEVDGLLKTQSTPGQSVESLGVRKTTKCLKVKKIAGCSIA